MKVFRIQASVMSSVLVVSTLMFIGMLGVLFLWDSEHLHGMTNVPAASTNPQRMSICSQPVIFSGNNKGHICHLLL